MNGFGFIDFDNHLDARDTVYAYHGSDFGGRRLVVNFCRRSPRPILADPLKRDPPSFRYTSRIAKKVRQSRYRPFFPVKDEGALTSNSVDRRQNFKIVCFKRPWHLSTCS